MNNSTTQAVLLAAGKSSRFIPFADMGHKSSITMLGKPLIVHTLLSIAKTGIQEVVIIIGKNSTIPHLIGQEALPFRITYVVQKEAEGMGDALLAAQQHLHDSFFMLHAHHVDFSEFKHQLEEKAGHIDTAVLLAKEDHQLMRYGVLKVDNDTVLDITEKPIYGKIDSNLRIIGIYLLNKTFLEVLKKTSHEHYHFEKALSRFAQEKKVKVAITNKNTVSLKYAWDILAVKNSLLKKIKRSISTSVSIAKSAQIIGKVQIEDGVTIMENACIKGPAYIGKNAFIGNNAVLREGVDIEEGGVIGGYMEIKNSLVMASSTTHSGFIGDSVIGFGCKIAAFFCTGNVRLDRQEVRVAINGEKINTGLPFLGVLMGNNVKTGVRVSTMPGILIGNDTIIGPSTTITHNVVNNVRYYTTFHEIIEENQKTKEKKKISKKKIVLLDIDYTLFDTDTFKASNLQTHSLYEEVAGVIEQLSSIAELGIFSEGDSAFQQEKLVKTEIYNHFLNKHIHIVTNKDSELERIVSKYKDRNVFLVDDRLSVLQKAKLYHPDIFTVWVQRGKFAKNQELIPGFLPDATVKNLHDVVSIVTAS